MLVLRCDQNNGTDEKDGARENQRETREQLRKAKEVGKQGELIKAQTIKQAATKVTTKVPELYVKHHKTNRGQWFE